MTTIAICEGARGFLVQRLQKGLGGGLTRDGRFGQKTAERVREVQEAIKAPVTGNATEPVWNALGLQFPSVFERCLMLTAAYEGTGFGGVNRKDIDGAGVTLGIVGFTTEHGEVQRLVSEYVRMRPNALHRVPSPHREKLLRLTQISGKNTDAWDRWFYGGDEYVDSWIRDVVKAWGEDDLFQRLQIKMTEQEFWQPAVRSARELGLESMPALGLLFDTHVQNGGWKEKHKRHYLSQSHDGSERMKLMAMVKAIAAGALSEWQEDVYLRKVTFVSGGGTVHGHYFDLTDYGFPVPEPEGK